MTPFYRESSQVITMATDEPPSYAATIASRAPPPIHANPVIEAAGIRGRDEQEMQNMRLAVQRSLRIYNPEIEPEHDVDYPCLCPAHKYKQRKISRLAVQELWSKAVMYPGEKSYHDCFQVRWFANNPYALGVGSPYGVNGTSFYGIQRPDPQYHAGAVSQTIKLNMSLNAKAQAAVEAQEPSTSIWEDARRGSSGSILADARNANTGLSKSFKLTGLKRALSLKSPEEKASIKIIKGLQLRTSIQDEERGRWPDDATRQLVATYQEDMGMAATISDLRMHRPLQYLHLLRAGYFEPIPLMWTTLAVNPLKFTVDAAAGWRGITPAWRGFENTGEERLYWVLNHRTGDASKRLKPDMISALDMARARMASAVEPPPAYYSSDDACRRQRRFGGYSNQVMPLPLRMVDGPASPTDDTMILLDVSGSMDFVPMRPVYNQYLITGFIRAAQPLNKSEFSKLPAEIYMLTL